MMQFPLSLQTFVIGEKEFSLFAPDATAVRKAYESGTIPFPYWSKAWPAAIALSEFIVRHPQYVANKRVMEAGAGLGLPSLVAAFSAAHVLCTDLSADAVAIAAQSAAHHRLQNFRAAVLDWKELREDAEMDVLLLSDVNYEPANFDLLLKTILAFLNKGVTVLLSTPQRLMAKAFVAPLLNLCVCKEEYDVRQNEDSALITVMVLQKL